MARHTLDWSFGLINHEDKYLTVDAHMGGIGATANLMKKKQIFFLEQSAEASAQHVYIKGPLGKYLTVDSDGKFSSSGAEKGEEQEILIEAEDDGKWCLKSKKYGWYIGGSGGNLSAFITDKTPSDRKWNVHLAMHPQVCIKNVKRQRYVHMSASGDDLTTDENIPWGHDATLYLKFNRATKNYRIQASNGKSVVMSGQLQEPGEEDATADYVLEFSGSKLSFKNVANGKYMTSLGATGLLKSTKPSITSDEQYVLEDSYPQVTLKSGGNGKYISIKQGVEAACQHDASDSITDQQIFQLEPNSQGKWTIKSNSDKLWRTDDGAIKSDGIEGKTCTADSAPAESQYDIQFNQGHILISQGGKFVQQGMNKYLKVKGTDPTDTKCQFTFNLVNRPRIVLRGTHGFINFVRGKDGELAASRMLESNKSNGVAFTVTFNDGLVALSHDGQYWKAGEENVTCSSGEAEFYELALQNFSKLTLSSNGNLLQSAQRGNLSFSGSSPTETTLWEY